jgi:hypothetical protein
VGDDLRVARRKIEAVTGEQPHPIALALGKDAKTVVLDLVNPAVAGRRGVSSSRQTGLQRDGGLSAPSLGEYRHAVGIRRAPYASSQKAKATAPASTIPNPRTVIAIGSYAGINMVGPPMAPTPAPEIVTEQKFHKFRFRLANYPFG